MRTSEQKVLNCVWQKKYNSSCITKENGGISMYLDSGNLAHQYELDIKERLALQKKSEVEKRMRIKQAARRKTKLRMRTVMMIVTALSMAFLFVYGEVRQYEVQTAVESATSHLSQIEDAKNRAILNIEKTQDLTSIENTAINQYGMSKATQDQIVYLDLPSKDKVETMQKHNNIVHHALTKGEKIANGFAEKIRNIFG